MSVSTLANTTWKIKKYPSTSPTNIFSVNFVDALNNSYISFTISGSNEKLYYKNSSSVSVIAMDGIWRSPTWVVESYRVIRFVDGTDIANSTLITWLENNAELIPDDLTKTKWILNKTLIVNTTQTFNINFDAIKVSGSLSFDKLLIKNSGLYYAKSGVTEANVYGSSSWGNNNAYRFIKITGGSDKSNNDLKLWLADNATQVNIETLANTTWNFEYYEAYFNLNSDVFGTIASSGTLTNGFTVNGHFLMHDYDTSQDEEGDFTRIGTAILYSNYLSLALLVNNSPREMSNGVSMSGISYPFSYDTTETMDMDEGYVLTFTSGTDIDNLDLIAWLTNNSVMNPLVKYVDLSTLNLSVGTHTIKVKARASGFRDSEFSNSVSYVVAPKSFSVNFSYFQDSGGIVRIYDGQDSNGTLLYTKDNNVTGTFSATSSTGYLYIECLKSDQSTWDIRVSVSSEISPSTVDYGGSPEEYIDTIGGIDYYGKGNTFELVQSGGSITFTKIEWYD